MSWRLLVTVFIGVFLGSALGSGCGGELESELLEITEQAIVDGTVDHLHPEVGVLRTTKANKTSLCTATLIGTSTALTAAHCVNSSGTPIFELGGREYSLQAIYKHPSYNQELEIADPQGGTLTVVEHDIAILILAEEITHIAPALFSPRRPAKGDSITLVGFGHAAASEQDATPTKRVGQSVVGRIEQNYILYGKEFAPAMSNTCDGDSGGPGFIEVEGQERLLSVHSMGDPTCMSYGYDMLVEPYLGWIIRQSEGNVAPDINSLPMVTITSPRPGAVLAPTFLVKAEAWDEGSDLLAVELYVDDVFKHRLEQREVQFSLVGVPAGEHTVRIMAIDGDGGQQSAAISIKVTGSSAASPPPGGGGPEITFPSGGRLEGGCAVAGSPAPSMLPVLLLLVALLRSRWR